MSDARLGANDGGSPGDADGQAASRVRLSAAAKGPEVAEDGETSANAALFSTVLLSAEPNDSRKRIEGLLAQEARELDEIIVAHRRVIGRRDHPGYLKMLQQEDTELDRWFEVILLRFLQDKSSFRIAFTWKLRQSNDKEQTQRAFDDTMRNARHSLLMQLTDIRELRDDVRKQAFEFFEQVAPPVHQRIKEIKRKLSTCSYSKQRDESSKTGKGVISSTKHPIFQTVKVSQEELLQCEHKLKVLERNMMAFAHRKEMKLLKASDDPYSAPGEVARKLMRMRKEKESSVGMSFDKMSSRGDKVAVRKPQLLVSSYGAARRPAKTVLEELRFAREEMKQLADHQSKLNLIRRDLNVAAVPFADMPGSDALREIEQSVTKSVLTNVFGAKNITPAGGGANLAAALKGSPSRGWMAVKRANSEAHLRPMATPLWVWSLESGWHAHHGLARPASRDASRPSTANNAQPGAANRTLDYDVVPLVGRISTDPKQQRAPAPPGLGITPYGRPRTGVHVERFDHEGRWVPVLRPVAVPDTSSRASIGSRGSSITPTRSLPKLTWNTYGGDNSVFTMLST